MIIDKSKLQPLLWAVVGAWKAGDQDLHLRTDALDAFLGETTVEEVALSLLAEIKKLEAAKHTVECRFEVSEDTLSTIRGCLREAEIDIDQLKADNEALRKDAQRYRWLRDKQTFIWLIQDWFPGEAMLTNVDADIDAAMAKEAGHG
ncbi:hypothetical protein [Pseudomonas qingdaonensis]|uniref:hypothetical protein n=1 Tax=Pseudomonas qingdaonensis TaxID=2056231 RepID=UPI00242D5ACF|nr:hypothetical protein [Pseudomonas qingdaonensis]